MCFSVEYKTGMKMKIPNGGSGNGYYGHEAGVISYLDNVEGDVDVQGGGDADFSEYMWMENEEEFDKQVKTSNDEISKSRISNEDFVSRYTGSPAARGRGAHGRVSGGYARGRETTPEKSDDSCLVNGG